MAERNILKIKAKTQIIGFKEYWISLLITLGRFMLLQKFGIGIALLTIGFATFKHRDCRKGDESDAFYHKYTCVCLQILDCNAYKVSLDYYYFFLFWNYLPYLPKSKNNIFAESFVEIYTYELHILLLLPMKGSTQVTLYII